MFWVRFTLSELGLFLRSLFCNDPTLSEPTVPQPHYVQPPRRQQMVARSPLSVQYPDRRPQTPARRVRRRDGDTASTRIIDVRNRKYRISIIKDLDVVADSLVDASSPATNFQTDVVSFNQAPPQNSTIRPGQWLVPFIGAKQFLVRVEEDLGQISTVRRKAIVHTPCKDQLCVIEAFGSQYLARIHKVIIPQAPSFESTSVWGPPPGLLSSSANDSVSENTSKAFSQLQYEEAGRPRFVPYRAGDFAFEVIQNVRCLVTIVCRLPGPRETMTTLSAPTSNRDGLPLQCPVAPTKPVSSRTTLPGGAFLPLPNILARISYEEDVAAPSTPIITRDGLPQCPGAPTKPASHRGSDAYPTPPDSAWPSDDDDDVFSPKFTHPQIPSRGATPDTEHATSTTHVTPYLLSPPPRPPKGIKSRRVISKALPNQPVLPRLDTTRVLGQNATTSRIRVSKIVAPSDTATVL